MGWLGWVARPWYWITGALNTLGHLPGRRKARMELQIFRGTIHTPYDIQRGYKARGIHWKQDPKVAGFTIEWARKPWVTWKQRWGDCEDLMLLSEYLIKPLGYNTERWAISDINGNWHAILVFEYEGQWGLMSNTTFSVHDTKADAIRSFYGSKHRSAMSM